MIQNKKIKNAQCKIYNNIKFRSTSEVTIYKALLQSGFKVYYEPKIFHIWEGFKPTIPFYNEVGKKNKEFKEDMSKIIDITYKPDFICPFREGKGYIIIEVKGFENDVYPYKKKLFRAYLEKIQLEYPDCKFLFFEIRNKKQLLMSLEIIEKYEKDSCKSNDGIGELSSQ